MTNGDCLTTFLVDPALLNETNGMTSRASLAVRTSQCEVRIRKGTERGLWNDSIPTIDKQTHINERRLHKLKWQYIYNFYLIEIN